MKKMITLILIILISIPVLAPAERCLYAERSEIIQPFEALIDAIVEVESGGDTFARNILEDAYGAFQIRPVRLLDYMQRTGKNYSLTDCYDYEISKEIFLWYCHMYGPGQIERIAKSWNGSGSMTDDYWARVRKRIRI